MQPKPMAENPLQKSVSIFSECQSEWKKAHAGEVCARKRKRADRTFNRAEDAVAEGAAIRNRTISSSNVDHSEENLYIPALHSESWMPVLTQPV